MDNLINGSFFCVMKMFPLDLQETAPPLPPPLPLPLPLPHPLSAKPGTSLPLPLCPGADHDWPQAKWQRRNIPCTLGIGDVQFLTVLKRAGRKNSRTSISKAFLTAKDTPPTSRSLVLNAPLPTKFSTQNTQNSFLAIWRFCPPTNVHDRTIRARLSRFARGERYTSRNPANILRTPFVGF